MVGSVGATQLGLLLLQILIASGHLARPQRSSLFPEAPLVEHVEQLPPLGWNSVGGGLGGLGGFGGGWGYSPVGLGHMSKDELLTLLEAWKEVEQEQESLAATTAAPPAEETTSTTRRPLPPPPPPPPRPIPIPISIPMPVPPQLPPSGTPITVRLPAFVPIRLAAVFTPPAGGGVGGEGGGAAPPDGGDDLATDDAPDDDATPRLFRFMPMPGPVRSRTQFQIPRQQAVVRNTLDSVDVGTAPVRQQVRPEVKPKAAAAAAAALPPFIPKAPSRSHPAPAAPFFRPRFGMPPHLANARFELVPSSQVIGDWRE